MRQPRPGALRAGKSLRKEQPLGPLLKTLSALALMLCVAGCVPPDPPYPNVVPIDTTGNFGAH